MVTGLIGQLAGRLRSVSYKLMRKWYYNDEWAQTILKNTGAQVICFGHIMPKLYVVDAFLRASRRMSIPSLALPHGVYLYTNEATKPKATDERRLAKFNRFDYIIVTNELRKEILTHSGVAEDKISVLGSARYCGEWLEQNRKILPGGFDAVSKGSGKLKVVLMPSKPQCRVDVERMFRTCEILADLEGIEGRTRENNKDMLQKLDVGIVGGVGYKLLKGQGWTIGAKYYYGFVDAYKNIPGTKSSSINLKVNIPIGAGAKKEVKE